MDSKMVRDITLVIEKHLPQQTVSILTEQLNRLTELEKTNEEQETFIEKQKARLQELEVRKGAWEELNKREKELKEFENALNKRDVEQMFHFEKMKREQAELRAADAINIVGLVFRSPIMRQSISENFSSNGYYDSQGRWLNNGGVKITTTETKEE